VKRFYHLFGSVHVAVFVALLLAPQLGYAAVVPEREVRGITPAQARIGLLRKAESFLGVPYRWAGSDRRGMDCSGFIYTSFRESLQLTIPRTTLGMYNSAQKIQTAELQPGDLVFFVTVGSRVSHAGIYIGGGRFIHAASDGPRTGVIISRLDESFWQRTYRSAGRVLPWDARVEREMAAAGGSAGIFPGNAASNPLAPTGKAASAPRWGEPGFFAGAGASWNWGGGGEGTLSPFRSVSFLATAGYTWTSHRLALELRPQWDSSLNVFRLPATLSLGTDRFQVFAGPAFIFGDPHFDLDDGPRNYLGGWSLLWEAGISASFLPIQIKAGVLSLYGELAWQSYQAEGQFRARPDIAANVRVSTGLRYLWRL